MWPEDKGCLFAMAALVAMFGAVWLVAQAGAGCLGVDLMLRAGLDTGYRARGFVSRANSIPRVSIHAAAATGA